MLTRVGFVLAPSGYRSALERSTETRFQCGDWDWKIKYFYLLDILTLIQTLIQTLILTLILTVDVLPLVGFLSDVFYLMFRLYLSFGTARLKSSFHFTIICKNPISVPLQKLF